MQFQVLCGSEEGSLTVWDLRHSAFPASYLRPHDNCAITDVAYHRTDPTKLFTTSEAGELYQWSYKANLLSDEQLKRAEGDNINPWLCGDRTKNKITVNMIAFAIQNWNHSNQIGSVSHFSLPVEAIAEGSWQIGEHIRCQRITNNLRLRQWSSLFNRQHLNHFLCMMSQIISESKT